MRKKTTFILSLLCSFFHVANAQFESANVTITDPHSKDFLSNPDRRSSTDPVPCKGDTVEYPRYKATSFHVVTGSAGRGLAQFYGTPQTLTISGATFYAYIVSNPPTPLTTKVYVNLYRAGNDSLPLGSPLRSDTVTLDSTFGNGLLTNIEKYASFTPIDIDFDYIIAVETDVNDTLNVGMVANSWASRDGRGQFLNAGSINGIWYRGRNLNIGGTVFDADMVIYPHVKYKFGTDFEITSQCFSSGTPITFINKSKENVSSSIFYNRYAFSNQEMLSHRWTYDLAGNPFSSSVSINGQTTYSQSQPYTIRLVSLVLQWKNNRFCYDTAIHTIYPQPPPPSILGGGIKCAGDDIILTTNAQAGTSTRWVHNINDTAGVFSGDTLLIPNLNKDTTLYAKVSNGICLSNAVSITIPVYQYPSSPVVKNDSICAGSRSTLLAVSPGSLSIDWFKDSSTNLPFHNGPIYQTPVLQSDTFFFVRASNHSCVSSGFVKVSVSVGQSFAPDEPIYSGDTAVCGNTSPLVTLRAEVTNSNQIRWFNQANGGTPVGTGKTFSFSPTQRGIYNYFVEAWDGSCGSSRVIASIEVDNAPAPSLVQHTEICSGKDAQIRIAIPYGKVTWFTSATGGPPLISGEYIDFFKIEKDTTLYAETSSGICTADTRIPVNVVVNTPPDFLYLTGDTVCSRSFATLKAGVPYGLILWYDQLTDTIPIGIGATHTTPSLLGSKDYFVATQFKNCISKKTAVTSTVNPRPFSGFFYDIMNNYRIQLTPLTLSGSAYNWDFGDGNSSTATSPMHQYNDSGKYNVRLILTSNSNGCKDTTINNVYLPWRDNTSVLPVQNNKFNLYPNPSTNFIVIEGQSFTGVTTLEIFTLNGQKAFEQSIYLTPDTSAKIEHNLTNGLYFIKVENSIWKISVEQ